jgi:steroid 5-alpha reductase family enzyme
MGISFSSLAPVVYTDIAIQTGAFAISAPLKTEKLYDISGSMTYAACIIVSLLARKQSPISLHLRQKVVSGCALIWTTRLGLYLGYRVMSHGKDSRFEKVKQDPLQYSVWY